MWWCCGTIKNVELVSAPISTKPTYAKPLVENTSESLQLSGTDASEVVAEASTEVVAEAEKAPLVQAEAEAEPEAEAEAEAVAERELQETQEAQDEETQDEETQEEEAQEADEEAEEESASDEVSETSYNSDESDTSQLLQVEVKVIRVKRYVCSKNLKTSVSIFLFGTAAYFLANLNQFRRFFTPM